MQKHKTNMRSNGSVIVKSVIINGSGGGGPVIVSRNFLTISLIVINLCSCSMSALTGVGQQNTSLVLDSWINDSESGYDEIITDCSKHCSDEEQYYGNLPEIGCRTYKDLCSSGCNEWKQSTFSSCKQICHDDTWHSNISPCGLACISGCNRVIHGIIDFLQQSKDFRTPLELVNASTNGTSLTLSWPIEEEKYSPERLVLQWSYEGAPQKWRFLSNFHWFENYTCVVEKLLPFTRYRFRVAMMVTTDHSDFVYTSLSEVVQTLPMGTPSSTPTITQVLTLDYDKIAVFWKPGHALNAPLEEYIINAMPLNSGDNSSSEVRATPADDYTILHGLQPQQTYDIAVSMKNAFGEGPSAMAVASTDKLPDETPNTMFIVVGESKVSLLNISSDGSTTKELYKSDISIVGFDCLIEQQMFFVSDDSGQVYRINMRDEGERHAMFASKASPLEKPSKISADWLNSWLYILNEVEEEGRSTWQIARTGFAGNNVQLVVEGLEEEPCELQVDPLNGYLFWITLESGVFRLDLADQEWQQIYKKPSLSAFSVDFKRYLITSYSAEERRFVSTTFDGRFAFDDDVEISSETIVDLAQYDFNLYWTDGDHIYSNKSMTVLHDSCKFLKPFQVAAQSVPIPTDPPGEVQALLTANKAKLLWKSPRRGYFQGVARWTDWSYDLEVKEDEVSVAIRDIKTEFFTVEKLKPDTEYWFRVRATSMLASTGPWSEWFRSKTWSSAEERSLLWATENGVLRSDEVGDGLEVLVNGSISSLAWVNGTLFLVKDHQLHQWDGSNLSSALVGDTLVGDVAYDWKGKKLYFMDESKGVVSRCNLDGTERELLPIFGVKHLELDSENGYLYYSTGLLIEACNLSGRRCMTYYRTSLFSEEDVIGPTFDLMGGRVFWMTQSDQDVYLFSSVLAHEARTAEALTMILLDGSPLFDWFSHVPGRLLWSTNGSSLVLGDERGENQALLNLNQTVHGVLVTEPMPEADRFYAVVPRAVNTSTVKVIGLWDSFNITWEPVLTDGEYNISYSIKVGDNVFMESTESSVWYPYDHLPPYSRLQVWIRTGSPWSNGPIVTAEIYSPTAAPSAPQRVRVFINRINNPLEGGQNISAVVRWEPPEEPNGPIVLYNVVSRRGEEPISTQNSTDAEAVFRGLEENVTYSFQVQAFTSGAGGNLSEEIDIAVNSKFQSVPRLLVASTDYIGVLDMDLNSTEILVATDNSTTHLAAIREENVIFWVNAAGQLMIHYDGNQSVLRNSESEVQALTVDWVFRTVYYSQVDHGGGSTIHYIDLNRFEYEPIGSELLISSPNPIKDLVVLPFSHALLWLEQDGSLHGWNLRALSEINLAFEANATFQKMYPGSFEENAESLILVDSKENICKFDYWARQCQVLKIGVDTPNLHLAWDNGFIYALKNHSIRAYNRRKQTLEYLVNAGDINEILAFSVQPYPERKCLLPDYNGEPLVETNLLVPQLVNSTTYSLELRYPRVSAPVECSPSVPGLKYNLFLKEVEKDGALVREIHSFEPRVNVTDLKPFTKYTLQLQVSNYYADKLGLPKILGPGVDFTTAPGTPSVPRNITVSAVSPRDGLVEWMHPEKLNNDRVWYEVHWKTENPTHGVVHRHQKVVPETEDVWNSFLLSGLRPDHTYWVWLEVFSTESAYNTSSIYFFETFPEPEGLTFVESTAYSITLSWNASTSITSTFLLYSPLDVDDPVSVNITNSSHERVIESLEPKTKYSFHLKLFYSNSLHFYLWPPDNRFVFETLGDRPNAPGQPLIEHIKGEVFKIFWEPAKNNGAPIEEYSLEALQSSQAKRVRRSHYYPQDGNQRVSNKTLARLGQLPWAEELEPIQDKWIPYWNGTETSCIITELHTMRLLMFRGRARNSYGWGPYSLDSEMIAEPFVLPRKRDTLVFAIIAPITIVSTCVTMAMLIRYVHSRRKQAKKLLYESRPSIWGLDVATLQQVARSRNFSQTSSMLYTGKPLTDGDIALLPQISRNQITMQKFLGSGAFGEVYEGMVTYSEDGVQDRVAIKTLRKSASEQEKTELLQEAHLMSHFKHENIVKLIGVCFDLDSICIIMELMEGGDLQTYLRQARPTLSKVGSLSLLDLVTMCLDVCTGCRYLEDLHFLHRDLACRNCLVSSVDPQFRVVKIGDFGLARDIYKSDYYRKEGEGLLPVRWMAPECLVDGVFTSQSDIWSFGILLWEILSLGQQPYPAQSNLEVLNFVKEGGRLQQPQECPDKLYKLMIQCWSHEPKDRPTFQQCLNELLSMKLDILNIKHSAEYEGGITNMSYAESDEGSLSKISISSRDDNSSSLNATFMGQVNPNQRDHQVDDAGSELSSFKIPAPNEADSDIVRVKRKSVHYVNEGQSKL